MTQPFIPKSGSGDPAVNKLLVEAFSLPDKEQILSEDKKQSKEEEIEVLNKLIDLAVVSAKETGKQVVRISAKDATPENLQKASDEFKKILIENPDWGYWGFRIMIAYAIRDNQYGADMSIKKAEILASIWLSQQFDLALIPKRFENKGE